MFISSKTNKISKIAEKTFWTNSESDYLIQVRYLKYLIIHQKYFSFDQLFLIFAEIVAKYDPGLFLIFPSYESIIAPWEFLDCL